MAAYAALELRRAGDLNIPMSGRPELPNSSRSIHCPISSAFSPPQTMTPRCAFRPVRERSSSPSSCNLVSPSPLRPRAYKARHAATD